MGISRTKPKLLRRIIAMVAFLTVCMASAQRPGADGLGDRLYPRLGNGGYDVQHYDIDLLFEPDANHISATTVIHAVATHELSRFNLDLFGLSVQSVTVNDIEAAFERWDHELVISPVTPIAPGESFSVTVAYAGTPTPIRDRSVTWPELGWQEFASGYFATVNGPSGAMTWYPSNNHPRDKASYSFRITAPAELTVAANGVRTGASDNRDGTRTSVWQARRPMASSVATVVIGDFREARDESGPAPIRNFLPSGRADEFRERLAITHEMMSWLVDLLGPYPFAAYGVAVVPGFPGALENQTLSTFEPDMVTPTVIMHELAHQWFGNSLTPARWQDIWLNEGFATYFEWLYLEETQGTLDLERVIGEPRPALAPPGSVGVEDLFSASVYYRGALTLNALRAEVGDDIFFDILREYYQRHAHSVVTTADFIAAAEDVSGRELGALFDAWLYGEAMPELP